MTLTLMYACCNKTFHSVYMQKLFVNICHSHVFVFFLLVLVSKFLKNMYKVSFEAGPSWADIDGCYWLRWKHI